MNLRAFRMQFAILVSLLAAACGGGGGGSTPPPLPGPQPQTIAFAQQGPVALMIGASLTNIASGGGGTGAITYQSSDTSVLTINATSGAATGVALGTATVTATKAADDDFTEAEATYTVHVQTTAPMLAWIGESNSQVFLPDLAVGKQFFSVRADSCSTPENVAECPNAQPADIGAIFFSELNATLTTQAYYALHRGSVTANATLVAAKRFSERIGHAALLFDNRYWVIGGGEPQIPRNTPTTQHTILADVWSSPDGKSWKLETAAAAFGPRWFHQAVVHDGAMWVIDGAPAVGATSTDVWSSTDGVNWAKRTDDTLLPWHSTHLNVVTFDGAMWAVSGGTSFSSTDGVTWTARSAAGAIGGTLGRGYASLNVYDGNLWYIAGAPGLEAAAANAVNDVWKSSDGIEWVQVTPVVQFPPRFRHAAFVLNGRLWVYGGQVPDGAGGAKWALDAWSTTDGALWREENTGGLDATFLAKVVEQTGPDRVTLIGGIQRGYSNNVFQTTDGFEWTALSAYAQFSPRATRGASFNGQLWIVGGSTADTPESSADTNEIWRNNGGIGWTRVETTTIFPPRDGHCVVVFKGRLWVIGGWESAVGTGGTDTRLNDVWSSSDGVAWTKHEPADGTTVFAPRVGHDVAVFEDKLWVVGGNLQDGSDVNDVWSSPDGETWTLVQGNAAFSPRHAHRVVEFNDELWLTGGGTTLGTSDVWHSSDGITWTPETAGFAPRLRHAVEVFNGRIYLVGGVSGEDYETSTIYNDVWSSDDGEMWLRETPAAQFAPRSSPALVVHGPELWLAGGYGLSFFNDVWRSSDARNWRLGFSHDIIVP